MLRRPLPDGSGYEYAENDSEHDREYQMLHGVGFRLMVRAGHSILPHAGRGLFQQYLVGIYCRP